jgi:membrane protease YdiL (CAAX protease family)
MGGLAAGQLLAAAPFLWLLREAARHPRDSSLGGAIQGEDRMAISAGRSLLLGLVAMAIAYPVIATLGQIASLIETALRGELPDPVAHDTLRALVDGGGFATAAGLSISLLVVTAIPCCEEIAYRGLLQPAIGRGVGWLMRRGPGTLARSPVSRWIAIGFTSIAFSLMHLSALPEASRGSALVTLAGVSILLGWLYERSGRLWAPIAAHGLFNAINLAIALLPA